jgi:hypothetical protein
LYVLTAKNRSRAPTSYQNRTAEHPTKSNTRTQPTTRYHRCLGKGLKETRISQDRRLFWRLNSLGEEEEDWDEEEDEDWEEDEWSGAEGSGQESF